MFSIVWHHSFFFWFVILSLLVGISLGRNLCSFHLFGLGGTICFLPSFIRISLSTFSAFIYYIYYRYIYTYLLSFSCLVVWFIGLYGGLYIFYCSPLFLLYVPEHEARLVIFIYIFRRHNPTRYVCDFFSSLFFICHFARRLGTTGS